MRQHNMRNVDEVGRTLTRRPEPILYMDPVRYLGGGIRALLASWD